MPRRHTDLFEGIASFAALHAAALRAVRGKRAMPGAAAFMAGLERQLLRLSEALHTQSWAPGAHVDFVVRDPKRRVVSAAPFRDRVVHHALHGAIAPIFERGFIADSFANREGLGTHKALARYEHLRDRHRFVLRADIWRYFPSIDHAVLKIDLRRRIACEETLWLCDTVIDAVQPSSLQAERADSWFAGDDLFTPQTRPRGLPLGNLTSQFFANVFLDPLDHYCKEVLRAPYVRYVDDIALFSDDPAQLQYWRRAIEQHLAQRRLRLHPAKTFCQPCSEPAAFLGFVTAPGRRSLVPANVARFAQRLQGLRVAYAQGQVDPQNVQRRVRAWLAHAAHAQTWRLRQHLFTGGWFDPLWADGRPVEPPKPCKKPPGAPRRFVEQQPPEPARGLPQQEHPRQPEQQQRVPFSQHHPEPEPPPCAGGGRASGASRGAGGIKVPTPGFDAAPAVGTRVAGARLLYPASS